MNKLHERRDSSRIDLTNMNDLFRQCDISASSCSTDLDITILDISAKGMKLRLNCDDDNEKLNLSDEIFIRGCIFNDRIGFLSSQKGVTIWKDNNHIGLKFTPSLDIDECHIREMLKA
ncbi:PilZ domain-containing protein [Maridesulfovibrio frigidus]|uniref:PilZ domain-containing protein n=1 Tax=Maridesulfovibrio frigidus TaxID=340956 RepID=UPI0004E0EAE0|nr:PilZ domain-containing protein [Maridesulfovibrio frigidus]